MSGQPQPYSLDKSYLKYTQTTAQSSQAMDATTKPSTGVKEGYDTMSRNLIGAVLPEGTPNLMALRDTLKSDKKYDYDLSGNLATIPDTYGYEPSLEEVRNQDTTDLLTQENTTFALAAMAGVSVFILGVMLLSRVKVAPPTAP